MTLFRYTAFAVSALIFSAAHLLAAGKSGNPEFVHQSITPAYRAPVETVRMIANADVVFIRGGLDQNFGEGMRCFIERADSIIAEVILVKVKEDSSAALILDIAPEYSIQRGDIAQVKTVASNIR